MDVPTTLFEILQTAPEPRTAAQLAKALPGKVAPKAVTAALLKLAQAGKILALTLGKSTAYTSRPPLDLCAEALALRLPMVKEATHPARLKAVLPKTLQPWFDEALGRLVVFGLAYWLPKGKARLVLPRPVRPSDLISSPALKQLKKVLADANRYRREPRRIEDLLVWLDAAAPSAAVVTPRPKPVAAAPALTGELLLQWYAADRTKSSTLMIPIPHTWKHYQAWASSHGQQADVSTFRQALEALYNAGTAMLEPHERPQSLPEDERRLQVPMSLGPPGYYWSPMV